jgi:hypothetical protein
LITLAQHDDGVTTGPRAIATRWGVLLVAVLAVGAGGCTQTTTQAVTEPVMTAPIVLNSATSAPVAPTALAPAPAPAGTVAATGPAPVAAVPVAPAPQPVAVSPAPVAPQPVATAQPEPLPTAAPATATGGQFPNINQVPTQPGGTLLPETERARIIAELEALRAGQQTADGGNGGGGSDLAEQAQTHGDAAIKQIEACSEEGALQNNPACAPD